MSCATYPAIADRYRLMDPGASMGKGYGPIVVAREPIARRDAPRAGHRHPGVRDHGVPAPPSRARRPGRDRGGVRPDPAGGGGRAGRRRPPDPRGADHLRRDGSLQGARPGRAVDEADGAAAPAGRQRDAPRPRARTWRRSLSEALRASIRYAHAHPDEAVGYALRYGRGIDADTCTRFVHMYVNDYTVTLGEEGRRALETLYREAVERAAARRDAAARSSLGAAPADRTSCATRSRRPARGCPRRP